MRRASSRVIRVIAQLVFAEEDLLPTKKVGLPECHSITGTPVRFAADSRSRRPRRARVPNDNLVPAEHRSAAADKPLRAAVEDSQRVQRVGVDNTPAVGAEDCSLSRYQRSRPRRRRRECPGLPRSRNSPRLH